jgi:hypothetical protein
VGIVLLLTLVGFVALVAGVGLALLSRRRPRDEAPGVGRGWRVGHHGRDRMYYEEWMNGRWERLEIDGEMLLGPAHHVIYFASEAEWAKYPPWAHGRRSEIVNRIKQELRSPEYEYYGA